MEAHSFQVPAFVGLLVCAMLLVATPATASSAVATTLLSEPASDIKPNVSSGLLKYSPNGDFLAVPLLDFPYLAIYARVGDDYTLNSNPDVMPTMYVAEVSWTPDSNFLAIEQAVSPYVIVYERSGTTFTKIANPATLPTGEVDGLSWNDDGTLLATSHTTTPFVTIYQRSGSVLTKLANPATLPAGAGRSASFSPNGDYLAVGHATTPFITVYSVVGTTFTKLTNPATLPVTTVASAYWTPDNNKLILGGRITAPYSDVYTVSGATLTVATPFTLVGRFLTASWLDSNTMLATHQVAPYMTVVDYTNGVFTANSAPPSIGLTAEAYGDMSPEGDHFAVGDGPPYLFVYSVEALATVAASASATVSNLVGFDVDPAGTTAIARTDGGQFIRVYPAGTLSDPASKDTDCNRSHGVATMSNHVAYFDCDGDGAVHQVEIRSPSLNSPNKPSLCNDAGFCVEDIETSELEGDQGEQFNLAILDRLPIDYSNNVNGFGDGDAVYVGMAFADSDGRIGVWTTTMLNNQDDRSEAVAVGIATQTPDAICSHRDPNGNTYLYGSSSQSNVQGFRVGFNFQGSAQFGTANVIPTMTQVFPGSASTAGPRGVDCGDNKLAILNTGKLTVWNRTSGGQSSAPHITISGLTNVPVRGVAMSSDGNWVAYANAGMWYILSANTGEVGCSGVLPSGTFQDMELHGSASSFWVATSTTIAVYSTFDCTTGEDVIFDNCEDAQDLDCDGIRNSDDFDIDGDGLTNDVDPDDDGDGVPDAYDTSTGGEDPDRAFLGNSEADVEAAIDGISGVGSVLTDIVLGLVPLWIILIVALIGVTLLVLRLRTG